MGLIATSLLLGVVEGVAEWLPVSSTGHLMMVRGLLGFQVPEGFWNLFLVVVQLAAVLAFALVSIARLWPDSKRKWILWGKILLASVPAGAAGLLLDNLVEERLRGPGVFIAALCVYGVLYILLERMLARRRRQMEASSSFAASSSVASSCSSSAAASDLPDEPTWRQALGMGLFQTLALVPGTSRSGSTILGGLLLGVNRAAAVRFGFFMAIPVTFGAGLLKVAKAGAALEGGQSVALLLLGAGAAFAVSLLASRRIVGWLERHSLEGFGWYRVALGLALLAIGLLQR